MKRITPHLRADVRDWISHATPEEIAEVIELGYVGCQTMQRKKQNDENSAKKGQLGENYVYDIIKTDFKVRDTSKKGKSGDFHILSNVGPIMVEVKNYSRTIGRMELDKFYRDIDRNNQIVAGIFISLYSPIVGFKEKIKLRDELIQGRTIPIIYINDASPRVIGLMVDMLVCHLHFREKKHAESDEVISKIHNLSNELRLLGLARDQIHELRTMMFKSLDDLNQTITLAELGLSRTLDDIKQTIKWKRMIPQSTSEELWDFIKSTYGGDERSTDIKIRKRAIYILYDSINKEWYYSQKGIHISDHIFFIDYHNDKTILRLKISKIGKFKKKKVPENITISKKYIEMELNEQIIKWIDTLMIE